MSTGFTVNTNNISSFDAALVVVDDPTYKNKQNIYLVDVAAMTTFSPETNLRIYVTHPVHDTYTKGVDYIDIDRSSTIQSFYEGKPAGNELFLIGTVTLRDAEVNLDVGLKLQYSASTLPESFVDVPANTPGDYLIEYPVGSGFGRVLRLLSKNEGNVVNVQTPDLYVSSMYATKYSDTPSSIAIGDFGKDGIPSIDMDDNVDFELHVLGDDGKALTLTIAADKPEPIDLLTLDFYGSPDNTGSAINKEINTIRGINAVFYTKLPWDISAGIGIESYVDQDGTQHSGDGKDNFIYKYAKITIEPYEGIGLNALLTIDTFETNAGQIGFKSIMVYPKNRV
jgi:hypothetical protein